jgi:hypothetical protein
MQQQVRHQKLQDRALLLCIVLLGYFTGGKIVQTATCKLRHAN